MTDEDRYTRITLRIPKDLHARLQAEADASSKSINAEIIGRVQQTFDVSPNAVEVHLQEIDKRLKALEKIPPKKGKS